MPLRPSIVGGSFLPLPPPAVGRHDVPDAEVGPALPLRRFRCRGSETLPGINHGCVGIGMKAVTGATRKRGCRTGDGGGVARISTPDAPDSLSTRRRGLAGRRERWNLVGVCCSSGGRRSSCLTVQPSKADSHRRTCRMPQAPDSIPAWDRSLTSHCGLAGLAEERLLRVAGYEHWATATCATLRPDYLGVATSTRITLSTFARFK